MVLKCFRYRERFAWGYGNWEYTFVEVNGEGEVNFQEYLEEMDMLSTWSDKWRGVNWEPVPIPPKELLETEIKRSGYLTKCYMQREQSLMNLLRKHYEEVEMKKYHIHVYRTPEVVEFDIEAESEEEAKKKSLEIAKQEEAKWKDSPTKLLSLVFYDSSDLGIVVGLCGKAGSGKTTASAFLMDALFQAYRTSFGDAVKRIAREQFGWDGVKDDRGRRLLQYIGTECGRSYNPDIWVDEMRMNFEEAIDTGYVNIFVDDVRFDNEAQLIKNFGGIVIQIDRPDSGLEGEFAEHLSEKGVSEELIDDVIVNDGTKEELKEALIRAVQEYFPKKVEKCLKHY